MKTERISINTSGSELSKSPPAVTYEKESGLFGTAPFSYIFRLFWDFPTDQSVLVAELGQNWNQVLTDIKNLSG